jgi:hypothetical protein
VATFPIVDLSTDKDVDLLQVARLAAALGLTDVSDPDEVIRTATSRLADDWHRDPDGDPDAQLQGAADALARSLGRGPADRHDPVDVMWAAAARLDATPVVPGEVAADLPYGSLIVRSDQRGTPLDLQIVRVGDPGWAVRVGAESNWYRLLYRPIESTPELGQLVTAERARRLPEGSIVVRAVDTEEADAPDPDAPTQGRQADGTWEPTTPQGGLHIVLWVGRRT